MELFPGLKNMELLQEESNTDIVITTKNGTVYKTNSKNLIAAYRKNEAKKPIVVTELLPAKMVAFCPTCKNQITDITKYCKDCGQRLNWNW